MLRLIVLLNKCCLEWTANKLPGSVIACLLAPFATFLVLQEKLQVRPGTLLSVSWRVFAAPSVEEELRTSLVGRGGPTSGSFAVLLPDVPEQLVLLSRRCCCVRRRSPWSGRGDPPAEAQVRC
eukprot:2016068-Amphidinium_carterae.1